VWKEKQLQQADTYQQVLAQGRQNLQELRSGKGLVNLKDQKVDAERMAVDREYEEKLRQRARVVQQEDEARLARQRVLDAERGIVVPSNDDAEPPNLWAGSALAGLAVAAVGAGSVLSKDKTADKAALLDSSSNNTNVARLTEDRVKGVPAELPTVDLGSTVAAAVTTSSSSGLYGSPAPHKGASRSSNNTVVAPEEPDPQELARQAMEEYMNRDDGASDWLSTLSEMIEEKDDEDVDVEDDNASTNELVTQSNQQQPQDPSSVLFEDNWEKDDKDDDAFQ